MLWKNISLCRTVDQLNQQILYGKNSVNKNNNNFVTRNLSSRQWISTNIWTMNSWKKFLIKWTATKTTLSKNKTSTICWEALVLMKLPVNLMILGFSSSKILYYETTYWFLFSILYFNFLFQFISVWNNKKINKNQFYKDLAWATKLIFFNFLVMYDEFLF